MNESLIGLLDHISNFRYAKYYLILPRNVASEAFQVLLNLKFSKIRNKPVLLKPHLSRFSFKKNNNLATSILQPIVKAVLDWQIEILLIYAIMSNDRNLHQIKQYMNYTDMQKT